MNWSTLESIESLKDNEIALIFKHSPRCIISRIVLKRFEWNFKIDFQSVKFYKLDVIKERCLSNKISNNGYKKVKTNFNWDLVLKKYSKII